ncbi:MAG: hypothetical protein K9G60_11230, partial [Pseudolabrys sp.]|nr:hypothetical protein [Pseudolabrys sp.]
MKRTCIHSTYRRTSPGSWLRAAALACTAAFVAPQMAAAQPAHLTIASFSQGSSWYVYAVNLAELLRDVLPAGSTIDTPPIAGGLANPQLVAAGKAQLGFGMAAVGNWAMEGKIGYKEPLKNLRSLVGGLDDYYLVAMARGKDVPTDLTGYFDKVNPKARVTLLSRGSIGSFAGQQLLDLAGAGEEGLAAHGGNYGFRTFGMVKDRFAARTA